MTDETGQSIVEYAIIVTFLAIFIIAMMAWLAPVLRDFMKRPVSDEAVAEKESAVSSAMYD